MSKIQKNQKILMINLPFSGHVNPTLPLAECLVKRGHSVDYICTEQFRQKIENTGASFIPYSSFPKDPTENEKKKLSFMAAFNTALEHKGEYDILIYEMFFYPGIKLAELLGIPCIGQHSETGAVFALKTYCVTRKKNDTAIKQYRNHKLRLVQYITFKAG